MIAFDTSFCVILMQPFSYESYFLIKSLRTPKNCWPDSSRLCFEVTQ